jgi:hypothetical protein
MSQNEETKIAYEGFLDIVLYFLIGINNENIKNELEKETKFWNETSIKLNKPHLSFNEILNHIIKEEEFEDLNDSLNFGNCMYHSKEHAIQFLNFEKRNIPRTKELLIEKHNL